MRNIKLSGVSKSFDGESIVENINLEIPGGRFFALLGPSGCGKTTILRLIAGLEEVDAGSIYLGKENITHVPIHQRKINTVFQQYALFPHFTVGENVAYPLRVRNRPEKEIRERVFQALKMVRLINHEHKYPRSLSGGQQQRVALARAIINEPEVLLLDEPLAALDFRLKEQMLLELIDIQDKLKTTFVYITHDQGEALTVADLMAIMNENGVIEQIGSSKKIYEFPESRFVAEFVGNTNFLDGLLKIDGPGKHAVVVDQLGEFTVSIVQAKSWMHPQRPVTMSIRPEKILISKNSNDNFSNHLAGRVVDIIYYGCSTQYRVKLANDQRMMVFTQNEEHFPAETIDYDDFVYLYFQKENVIVLDRV